MNIDQFALDSRCINDSLVLLLVIVVQSVWWFCQTNVSKYLSVDICGMGDCLIVEGSFYCICQPRYN